MSTTPAGRGTGSYSGMSFRTGLVTLGTVLLAFTGVPGIVFLGLIGGAIAITYGVVGCCVKEGGNHRCTIGLIAGAAAFLAPLAIFFPIA